MYYVPILGSNLPLGNPQPCNHEKIYKGEMEQAEVDTKQ